MRILLISCSLKGRPCSQALCPESAGYVSSQIRTQHDLHSFLARFPLQIQILSVFRYILGTDTKGFVAHFACCQSRVFFVAQKILGIKKKLHTCDTGLCIAEYRIGLTLLLRVGNSLFRSCRSFCNSLQKERCEQIALVTLFKKATRAK